ncbi:hypothetical protein H0X06_07025 [Candidatus Dependentiae bacterium]|nr:hypothetical protein [Candidatus Dependentiae bacterium]
MEFKLIGPTSSRIMNINWLEAQTASGSFVVKSGHAPLIAMLAPNKELTVELHDGSTTIITIVNGILEVTRTSITLLLTHE